MVGSGTDAESNLPLGNRSSDPACPTSTAGQSRVFTTSLCRASAPPVFSPSHPDQHSSNSRNHLHVSPSRSHDSTSRAAPRNFGADSPVRPACQPNDLRKSQRLPNERPGCSPFHSPGSDTKPFFETTASQSIDWERDSQQDRFDETEDAIHVDDDHFRDDDERGYRDDDADAEREDGAEENFEEAVYDTSSLSFGDDAKHGSPDDSPNYFNAGFAETESSDGSSSVAKESSSDDNFSNNADDQPRTSPYQKSFMKALELTPVNGERNKRFDDSQLGNSVDARDKNVGDRSGGRLSSSSSSRPRTRSRVFKSISSVCVGNKPFEECMMDFLGKSGDGSGSKDKIADDGKKNPRSSAHPRLHSQSIPSPSRIFEKSSLPLSRKDYECVRAKCIRLNCVVSLRKIFMCELCSGKYFHRKGDYLRHKAFGHRHKKKSHEVK